MRADRADYRFWLGSALLHGGLLILVLVSPVGQRVFRSADKTTKAPVIRRGEALADVVDDIRDLAAERMKAQVELLRAGRERMAANFLTMNAYYQPFVAQQLSTVRARLTDDAVRIFEHQTILLKAAERAMREGVHGSDPMWRAYDRNRAQISAGQDEIRRALLLKASDDASLTALQKQSEAEQFEVFRCVNVSVGAQNNLWGGEKRLAALLASLEELQPQIEAFPETLRELDAQIAAARAALPQARAAVEEARKEFSRDHPKVRQAEGALRTAEKRLADAEGLRGRKAQELSRLEERRDKLQTERQGLLDRVPVLTEQRDRHAQTAAEMQQRAIATQRDVYERLLKRIEEEEQAVVEQESTAQAPKGETP